MKLHAPLFPLALCLMAGIAAGRWLEDWTTGLAVLIPLVMVTSLLSRFPRWQTAALWTCMVVLGATLGTRVQHQDNRKVINQQSYHLRQLMTDRYRQWGISDEAIGVVAAMTLGEKSQLDKGLKDTYSKVGASHVLALSGLHLMIIYAFISLFIAWRRFRMVSQVVIIAALWAFAYLVGMSPSVVRSAFMISLYALLSLGYRERMSVNTLSLAAIVMLVVNPQSLYDISFQSLVGHDCRVTVCPTGDGTHRCLLLRTVLYLVSAEQLCGHTPCHHHSVPDTGLHPDQLVGVAAAPHGGGTVCRGSRHEPPAGGHRTVALLHHRRPAAIITAGSLHIYYNR